MNQRMTPINIAFTTLALLLSWKFRVLAKSVQRLEASVFTKNGFNVRTDGRVLFFDCSRREQNLDGADDAICWPSFSPFLIQGVVASPCAPQTGCVGTTPPVPLEETVGRYFQLGTHEAVLLFGRLPPPCMYFSFNVFVWEEETRREEAQSRSMRVPLGWRSTMEGRSVVAATVGDDDNFLRLRAASPDDETSKKFHFNEETVLIVTANATLAGIAQQILENDGISTGKVNIHGLPSDWFTPSLSDSGANYANVPSFLHEFSVLRPIDEEMLTSYIQSNPIQVWRLTVKTPPDRPLTPIEMFPVPIPSSRRTGHSEKELVGKVTDLLRNRLVMKLKSFPSSLAGGEVIRRNPSECVEKRLNCLALENDVTFMVVRSPPAVQPPQTSWPLAEGGLIVFCGVNHKLSNFATDFDVAVVNAVNDQPILHLNSETVPAPPSCLADQLLAPYFYCLALSHNCRMLEANEVLPCHSTNATRISLTETVRLNPTLRTGPDPQELLPLFAMVYSEMSFSRARLIRPSKILTYSMMMMFFAMTCNVPRLSQFV